MRDAPTSDTAAPNPAMTAANRGILASCNTNQSIWKREAPSAYSCGRSPAGSDPRAATVKPVTSGAAINVCAITIAAGV